MLVSMATRARAHAHESDLMTAAYLGQRVAGTALRVRQR
jgi:hypothetical protein